MPRSFTDLVLAQRAYGTHPQQEVGAGGSDWDLAGFAPYAGAMLATARNPALTRWQAGPYFPDPWTGAPYHWDAQIDQATANPALLIARLLNRGSELGASPPAPLLGGLATVPFQAAPWVPWGSWTDPPMQFPPDMPLDPSQVQVRPGPQRDWSAYEGPRPRPPAGYTRSER